MGVTVTQVRCTARVTSESLDEFTLVDDGNGGGAGGEEILLTQNLFQDRGR